jgi:hypothetical protein
MKALAKVFVCHFRSSNWKSKVFEKQGVLDSRLRGNDVKTVGYRLLQEAIGIEIQPLKSAGGGVKFMCYTN